VPQSTLARWGVIMKNALISVPFLLIFAANAAAQSGVPKLAYDNCQATE
jgi:hypothetical protein